MKENCLFCKIIERQIPASLVSETEDTLAFRDINPVASTHILIIPKEHISTINDIKEEQASIIGKIIIEAKNIAKQENLAENGYRLVFNCNKDAGQTVFHIHCHLIGGKEMGWPPFPSK